MGDMEEFRRRCAEAKHADDARNVLLDDLLQKVDDMQKTMDRNAFVMVLIDGDCMIFLNELVKQGVAGGDEAAKLLRRAVFEYLRYEEDFKHDHKIVIRVYANLRGLSKTYVDKGILPNPAAYSAFVLGFNKAHPLCDFVDAGNYKEAADTKLKVMLNLHIYNVHCKHIIFGASADNGYAVFLSSFIDTDVSTRIRLLKGTPFSFEFKNMLSKFKWTEFKSVFRSDFIAKDPAQEYGWHRSLDGVTAYPREPLSNIINQPSSMTWRPKTKTSSRAIEVAVNENHKSASEELMEFSDASQSELDQESDANGVDVSSEQQHDAAPALSSAFANRITISQASGRNSPNADEVAAALIRSTKRCLKETPAAVDFSVVKQRVEQTLSLPSSFWGQNEHDEWFFKSKNIIKITIEDWIERTDNPPPKNATWMLRYFTSSPDPSALVIKRPSAKTWRTQRNLGCYIPNVGISQNAQGQRIDMPKEFHANHAIVNDLREREPRLCNAHYLNRGCSRDFCTYDHTSVLADREFDALLYLSRSQACLQGSECTVENCIKGHMCPNGRDCRHGDVCRFAHLHGIDTVVMD